MGERGAGIVEGCGCAGLALFVALTAACLGLWGLGVATEARLDREAAEAARSR